MGALEPTPADLALEDAQERRGALRGPFSTHWWEPHIPVIWARTFTLNDERTVAPFARDDDPAGWAEIVIRCARDRDGRRVFKPAHRRLLTDLTLAAHVRLAAQFCMGTLDPAGDPEPSGDELMEELRGNSEAIQSAAPFSPSPGRSAGSPPRSSGNGATGT